MGWTVIPDATIAHRAPVTSRLMRRIRGNSRDVARTMFGPSMLSTETFFRNVAAPGSPSSFTTVGTLKIPLLEQYRGTVGVKLTLHAQLESTNNAQGFNSTTYVRLSGGAVAAELFNIAPSATVSSGAVISVDLTPAPAAGLISVTVEMAIEVEEDSGFPTGSCQGKFRHGVGFSPGAWGAWERID